MYVYMSHDDTARIFRLLYCKFEEQVRVCVLLDPYENTHFLSLRLCCCHCLLSLLICHIQNKHYNQKILMTVWIFFLNVQEMIQPMNKPV